MTETARRYMGNSVLRKEDPAFLTGHANWTDNIKLPGMLHIALLHVDVALWVGAAVEGAGNLRSDCLVGQLSLLLRDPLLGASEGTDLDGVLT